MSSSWLNGHFDYWDRMVRKLYIQHCKSSLITFWNTTKDTLLFYLYVSFALVLYRAAEIKNKKKQACLASWRVTQWHNCFRVKNASGILSVLIEMQTTTASRPHRKTAAPLCRTDKGWSYFSGYQLGHVCNCLFAKNAPMYTKHKKEWQLNTILSIEARYNLPLHKGIRGDAGVCGQIGDQGKYTFRGE